MRFPVFAAALLCASAAAFAQTENARDYNPLLAEGDARFNHGDTDGAIDSYSRALLANPRLTAGYARRGRAYRAKGVLDKALLDLDHAVNMNPEDPFTRRERGHVQMARADWEAAITDYSVSIQQDATDHMSVYNRGLARLQAGRLDDAVADFTLNLKANPENAAAFAYRGMTFNRKGDPARAQADFYQALRLNPRYIAAYVERARLFNVAKDWPAALKDLGEAIRLEPREKAHYFNRAAVHAAKGDLPAALADYTRVLEMDPDSVETYRARALILERKDDLLGAMEDYAKGLDLEPRDGGLYLARESFRLKKEQLDEAIADYSRAIDKDFQYPLTLSRRAELRHRKQDYVNALADIERALVLAPKTPYYYQTRGDIRRDRGDLKPASEDFSKALDLGQAPETAGPRLVVVNLRLGGLEAGLATCTALIRRYPAFGWAYAERGRLRMGKVERKEALSDLDQGLSLNADLADYYAVRGDLRESREMWAGAVEDYAVALKKDSTNAALHAACGRCLRRAGKPDEATAAYSRSLELAPGVAWVLTERAELAVERKAWDAAIKDSSDALRANPGFLWATLARARAQAGKGDAAQAIADYGDAIQTAPTMAALYAERAAQRKKANDEQGASQDLVRAQELDSVNSGKPTVADYKKILESGTDGEKTRALAALGTLATPEAVAVIAAEAGGPDARLRTIAAWELGRARAVDRSDQLASLLQDPEASVRGAAAAALGLLHTRPPKEAAVPPRPAFVPALAALLKDPEAMVRGRVIQALLQIDAREYIKDVEGLLTDTGKTSVPDGQSKEWIALEVREVASRALEAWKAPGENQE